MKNQNDTIEQVCADLRAHDLIPPPCGAWVMYADRIADVYKHERRKWEASITDQRSINKKLADAIAAKDAEIERLRALVDGLIEASTIECADCNYDCGPDRDNCIIREAVKFLEQKGEK